MFRRTVLKQRSRKFSFRRARKDSRSLLAFARPAAAVGHPKDVVAIPAAIFTQLCDKHQKALDARIIPDHQVIGVASRARHIRIIVENIQNCELHLRILTKVRRSAIFGTVGSTLSLQARIPPFMLRALVKPDCLRKSTALAAADPTLAVHHNLVVSIELSQAFRYLAERNQPRARNAADWNSCGSRTSMRTNLSPRSSFAFTSVGSMSPVAATGSGGAS